jgi:tetratricopeptide (TPR) repeat protein
MAIEGPLRELGIHDVFQLLDLSRKTGVLRVTSELRHNAGTIYFADGKVIFAEIRSNPHPLGALLVRTAKITEADLERARDMQLRQGDRRRLGEILVALGAITARELQRQVRFQIEEVVFEVMSWREGYFSFNEGQVTQVPPDAAVSIPTEALLMEGARRIDEWSRIESRIPHLGVIPTLAPPSEAGQGQLDLLPPEWEMLAMIDGRRDVRTIASELGRSDFEVAKTLFGLESAGVILLADPGTAPRERTAVASDLTGLVAQAEEALGRRNFEAARSAAEQAAGVHPHDPGVHLLLGRIDLAQGRGAEAVEKLRRALRLDPLLVAAHRALGYALVATARFAEAVEQWEQWERLAASSETESAHLDDVHRAKTAARTLAQTGVGGAGGAGGEQVHV